MNSGNFQIAVFKLERSPSRVPALRIPRFWSLIFALLLPGLVATLPLDAAKAPSAPALSAETASAQLQGVHFSAESSRTRVVLDLSADVQYKVGHLSDPQRLYFDLQQTEISPKLTRRQIALWSAVVDQIRIGVDHGPVTRVVLDLHSPVRYRVSKLSNPVRMLLELDRSSDGGGLGQSAEAQEGRPNVSAETQVSSGPNSSNALSEQATNLRRDASLDSQTERGPQPYGNGEKAGLKYAGTASPRNILLLGFDFGSSYDDNILGNNQHRVGDAEFSIGPSLTLSREGNRLSLALNYQPHVRIYRNASALNTLDQQLGFDTSYQATSRLSFRGRTNAAYTNGLFQPSQNGEFLPGLASPTSLNQTVYTPTAHQLWLNSRVDASYGLGRHDSVDFYGGESLLHFEQQNSKQGSLLNTRETDAGLVYEHRTSPHATLGIDYLFQNIDFGTDSRTQVNGGFLSYALQFSRSVTMSLFGGPQHSQSHGLLSLLLGPVSFQIPTSQSRWSWALGGTLTKRLDTTVFQFTAQHQVSNGGGLIGAVIGTAAGVTVRRRLPGHWDAIGSGNYADNTSVISGGPTEDYQSETAGFGLERPLTDKLSLRFGYDFLRQRGTGPSPLLGEVDRNLFSIQFSYRFQQIPLGQ